jgi:hypothetical protein
MPDEKVEAPSATEDQDQPTMEEMPPEAQLAEVPAEDGE